VVEEKSYIFTYNKKYKIFNNKKMHLVQ